MHLDCTSYPRKSQDKWFFLSDFTIYCVTGGKKIVKGMLCYCYLCYIYTVCLFECKQDMHSVSHVYDTDLPPAVFEGLYILYE